MNSLRRDLCGHQAWADTEAWRAIGALGGVPTTVDLIIWYAQGRPAPRWSD